MPLQVLWFCFLLISQVCAYDNIAYDEFTNDCEPLSPLFRQVSSPGMPSALIPSPAAMAPGAVGLVHSGGSFGLQHQHSGLAAVGSGGGGGVPGSTADGQGDSPAAAVTLGTQYQTLATYGSSGAKVASLLPAPPPISPPGVYTPGLGTSGAAAASAGGAYQSAYGAGTAGTTYQPAYGAITTGTTYQAAYGAAPIQVPSPAASFGGAGAPGAGASATTAPGAPWDPPQHSTGYSTAPQQQPWGQQQLGTGSVVGLAAAAAPGGSFVMPDEHTLAAYAAAAPPLNFADARRSPHGRPACCFAVLGVGARCVLLQPSVHAGEPVPLGVWDRNSAGHLGRLRCFAKDSGEGTPACIWRDLGYVYGAGVYIVWPAPLQQLCSQSFLQ